MIRFWCEFPEKVNWDKFKSFVNFKTEVYVAVENRKEFLEWEKKIKSSNIDVGAWSVLKKKEGYWFSGFLSKELIDKLDEFRGLKIKIDIEPLFPGKGKNPWLFVLKSLMRKGKNNEYLKEKIESFYNKDVLISGFPLPLFLRKRYGHYNFKNKMNFIVYSTFGKWLRKYYTWFIKKYDVKMVGVGCIGKGVFGNEPVYENLEEFKEDLEWIKKLGIKDITVFNVSGIVERGKEWFGVLEEYGRG